MLIIFAIIGIIILIIFLCTLCKSNSQFSLTATPQNELVPKDFSWDPYKETKIFWIPHWSDIYTPTDIVRYVEFTFWVFHPVNNNKFDLEIYDSNLNKIFIFIQC